MKIECDISDMGGNVQIGSLVKTIDDFVGIVIEIARSPNGENSYVEIQTAPDNEGYTRRVCHSSNLEVL